MCKSIKIWWLIFGLLSALLFAGYYTAMSQPELKVYLKGLSTLQHFSIHYTVGIAMALVVCTCYLLVVKRRPNEPMLLTIFAFLSHIPDIHFAISGLPHDKWEIIFLGHTVVDTYFHVLIWIVLLLIVGLFLVYKRLLRQHIA